uniref:Uncharacterized protein n=1 Tax=Lygus hesperus TaxID=30085 RepID=A0A0A9XF77_LYGHE
MPNTLLFNFSRVLGLCPYSPLGKFDPWLMLWSLVSFSCWFSALIVSKIALYGLKQDKNDRFLADSILNFNSALNAICVSYHLFINFQERSKMEDVFAVAHNIEPEAYEHSYVIFGSFLTIVIVICSWYGSDERHWWTLMDLGCYAVSVCTDFLLILQFCSLLKRISVKFREVKCDIRNVRRVDYLGHSGLVAVAEDLNRIYDVQLLLICSKIFATIVYSAYSFYGQLETLRDSLPSLTSLALAIVLCILMVFWLSDVSEDIYADVSTHQ